jgi:hypothetical protein
MTKKPRGTGAKQGKGASKPTKKAASSASFAVPAPAAAPSTAAPSFADIQNLLDTLVPPSDNNILSAPHQRFWRTAPTNTRDGFVNFDTSQWGQPGRLITPGDPNKSNFYLALAGLAPFDGSVQNQMPDVNADFNAALATKDQLDTIATWIKNGALA